MQLTAALPMRQLRPAALRLGSNRQIAGGRRQTMKLQAAVVPPQFGYVLSSVAVTGVVVQWMAIKVAMARRTSNVQYPAMYADGDSDAAMVFNCTQRAHQNTLENLPMMLAAQVSLGLIYPQTAAAAGLVWTFGRVLYALGYSSGDPSKRLPGVAISSLTQLAMYGACVYTGVRMLM